MKENPLIGRTLLSVEIAKDREALRFVTDAGELVVCCDADCCSHTWVEGIELPRLPAVVVSVRDLEMPTREDPSKFCEYPEVISFYGCEILTNRGALVIDYRNNSNGYYGGSLSWPGDYFYGGVHGQNKSAYEWEPA
jgi:hypothetical protein